MKKFYKTLDLQFFSNDEEFGAYEPEPIETGDNPLVSNEPSPGTEQPQEPQHEELDFGGRKVKVTDPQFHELHKDYSELNRTYQSTNQRLQELQQQNEFYQRMVEQGQVPGAQQQQQQQAEPTPQDVQARLAEINDEYMDKMYENKIEADRWLYAQPEYQQLMREQMKGIIEPFIQPMQEFIQPMQEEQRWQSEIQQVSQRHEDFNQYTDSIRELLAEQPHLAEMPNALETMYFVAKGRAAQNIPSPDQMLADPNFQQQIMQNEQIRNSIVNQYVGNKQQQNQQIPNMMGSQMGQAPSIPEEMPTSISGGSKLFRKYLGQ